MIQEVGDGDVKSRLFMCNTLIRNRRRQMRFPAAGRTGYHQPALRFQRECFGRLTNPAELFLTGRLFNSAFRNQIREG